MPTHTLTDQSPLSIAFHKYLLSFSLLARICWILFFTLLGAALAGTLTYALAIPSLQVMGIASMGAVSGILVPIFLAAIVGALLTLSLLLFLERSLYQVSAMTLSHYLALIGFTALSGIALGIFLVATSPSLATFLTFKLAGVASPASPFLAAGILLGLAFGLGAGYLYGQINRRAMKSSPDMPSTPANTASSDLILEQSKSLVPENLREPQPTSQSQSESESDQEATDLSLPPAPQPCQEQWKEIQKKLNSTTDLDVKIEFVRTTLLEYPGYPGLLHTQADLLIQRGAEGDYAQAQSILTALLTDKHSTVLKALQFLRNINILVMRYQADQQPVLLLRLMAHLLGVLYMDPLEDRLEGSRIDAMKTCVIVAQKHDPRMLPSHASAALLTDTYICLQSHLGAWQYSKAILLINEDAFPGVTAAFLAFLKGKKAPGMTPKNWKRLNNCLDQTQDVQAKILLVERELKIYEEKHPDLLSTYAELLLERGAFGDYEKAHNILGGLLAQDLGPETGRINRLLTEENFPGLAEQEKIELKKEAVVVEKEEKEREQKGENPHSFADPIHKKPETASTQIEKPDDGVDSSASPQLGSPCPQEVYDPSYALAASPIRSFVE